MHEPKLTQRFYLAGMDRNSYLELVDICYSSVDDNAAWRVFVQRLTDVLSADAGDFVFEDYANGIALPLGTVGFDPDLRLSYDDDFLGENPWLATLQALPRQQAFSNALEPEDFERSAYYNEWVRPQGFRHALGGFVDESSTSALHLGVLRNRDRPQFTNEDTAFLNRVFPHVRRAIELRERLKLAESDNGQLVTLVEQLNLPAFLIDRQGRVLRMSVSGEDLLRVGTDLQLVNGRLCPWIVNVATELRDAISAALQLECFSSAPERSEVILPRRDSEAAPLIIDVLPLRSCTVASLEKFSCLVTITDPSAKANGLSGVLQRMWNLTPTEARLALALARGITLKDFAEEAEVTLGTARWHLKNLQAKTGAHSIANVVSLVKGAALRP